ncbi:MAG: pyrroline-5-carboxylate reductase [Deltaproteobacteria bacterium RIFCSPLOWO2_02_FULL_53_8]|nr:MAG: pyrroline-5-carboxylate reductase [Deltaproteobacteria bacterium RIFCSPLOWO2_02_FULL_53_8]
MLTKKTIGFLGSGNLAEALIKGLLSSGSVNANQIMASDVASERLAYMAGTYDIKVSNNNADTAHNSEIILLTIKPKDIKEALVSCAQEIDPDKLIISAAAGTTTQTIQRHLTVPKRRRMPRIVRAMPNTPAMVRAGVTALCAGAGASTADLNLAKAIFDSVGTTLTVDDERLLDVVTGLSGSGPAYVFLFMESLAEAGIASGLSASAARLLAVQTTLGAATLALESPLMLDELRRMVASPGGTTIEGLKILDKGHFKETVIKAVGAASRRATEIANGK